MEKALEFYIDKNGNKVYPNLIYSIQKGICELKIAIKELEEQLNIKSLN